MTSMQANFTKRTPPHYDQTHENGLLDMTIRNDSKCRHINDAMTEQGMVIECVQYFYKNPNKVQK